MVGVEKVCKGMNIKMGLEKTMSVDTEKSFNKIQHPFMIKALNKLGTEGKFLNLIKGICENQQVTSYSTVKN